MSTIKEWKFEIIVGIIAVIVIGVVFIGVNSLVDDYLDCRKQTDQPLDVCLLEKGSN